MTQLANLQALFQDHVVSGTPDNVDVFVGDQRASASERAGVYYDAYRLRLVEILRIDFPGLAALMTAHEFDELGRRYLDAYPSRYPTVRWFGQYLVAFINDDEALAQRSYLAEMATFDWARGKAFDAADAGCVSVEALGAVPPDAWAAVRLDLHPSLQRSTYAWNIGPIWRAVNAGEAVPDPERLETPEQLALWRNDLVIYWRSLADAEAAALAAFAVGQSFAEVCDGLCDWFDDAEVPAAAAGMLRQWISEGLVTQIRTDHR